MKKFYNDNPILFDKFFYQTKNKTIRRSFLSVSLSVLVALTISFIIIVSLGTRPATFFAMFKDLFIWEFNTQQFIIQICSYIIAALAFSFCMQVGVFNIGISGQMLAGGCTSYMVLLSVQHFHPNVNIAGGQILTILLSIVGATLVALVTGLMKIYLKVNEVVSAILLNWIILLIVGAIIVGTTVDTGSGPQKLFLDEVSYSSGTFRSKQLFECFTFWNNNVFWGWPWAISLTIICVFAIWFIMKFTVFGHKLKTTGQSPFAAQNFGYNKNLLQLSSFAISGVLAGVLATIVYTSSYTRSLDLDTAGGVALNRIPTQGFDGIAIGLIALNNPIGIVIVSTIFAFPSVGAAPAGLPSSTIQLIVGVMMYIVAIYTLLNYFKPWQLINRFRYGKCNIENYMNLENSFAERIEKYSLDYKKNKNKIINEKISNFENGNKFLKIIALLFIKPYYAITLPLFSNELKSLNNLNKASYNSDRKKIIENFNSWCIFSLLDYWKHDDNISKHTIEKNIKSWNKDKQKIIKWHDYVAKNNHEIDLINLDDQFEIIENKINNRIINIRGEV